MIHVVLAEEDKVQIENLLSKGTLKVRTQVASPLLGQK
jgi:hypothetical protein